MNRPGTGRDPGHRSPLEDEAARARRVIRAELEDHVARRASALERQGYSAADARAEALRRLGDAERVEDDLLRIAKHRRRRRSVSLWLEEAAQDIRLALRGMRRRPALTAAVLATLGLAIGAAAAVFGVANGVLFRPLGFPQSERLFTVYSRYLPATGYDFEYFTISGPEYDDYRAMTRSMSGVALFGWGRANLSADFGEPERVLRAVGSANLLAVLGVAPVLGRGFAEGEDAPGRACVTVLSDGLWRDRYGADAGIIGQDVRLDGEPCEIVGVMPAGYWFPVEGIRLWTTMELDRSSPDSWHRLSHPYIGLARLAEGATRESAELELATLRAGWSEEYPEHYEGGHFLVLQPLLDDLVGDARPALLVLLGAVGVVLLIVCVNLAGLLLSSADARRREFAVRGALGVGRGRLVRQVLTESLLLALLGGAIGVIAAGALLQGGLRLYPGGLPRGSEVSIDAAVLGFATLAAVTTGILFGLLPALQTSAVRVHEVLRASGRGLTTGGAGVRTRQIFVIAQTALAMLLVVGATLLAQSYSRLRSVDLGFDAGEVLTFNVTVPEAIQPDPARARDYFARLEARLEAVPGAEAAGAISGLPLRNAGGADDFIIEGRPEPAPGDVRWNARYQMATPAALRALGLRLVRGRWLEPTDRAGAPPVAVINEALARLYYPGEDPVGTRIRYFGADSAWITIIGVIADVRSLGATQDAPPTLYTALAQAPRAPYSGRFMELAVRFRTGAAARAAEIRAAVSEIDPPLPPSGLATMESIVTASMGRPRFTLTLMSAFAGLALLLGALGLYGVLAHTVQQRIHEIGIRLTLGARRSQVVRMVVQQGLVLVVLGTVLGLGAAAVLRDALAALLFGVAALDPLALVLAGSTLLAVALVACGIPALRAMRVDPAIALRAD
ncbi:MAG: ABC transporter permease [Gemmatimonadetes bacterium]|nr:ABC transporter permease [Gemmatimonadota bacterium]